MATAKKKKLRVYEVEVTKTIHQRTVHTVVATSADEAREIAEGGRSMDETSDLPEVHARHASGVKDVGPADADARDFYGEEEKAARLRGRGHGDEAGRELADD